MNPYVNITARTFTVWLMASTINGLLCGLYFGIFGVENDPLIGSIFLMGIGSLFFSIPGSFIFWLTMLLLIRRKIYGRSLFRAALSTGLVLASATAVLYFSLTGGYKNLSISLFTILSALTSIMLHFNLFKKIAPQKQPAKNSNYHIN